MRRKTVLLLQSHLLIDYETTAVSDLILSENYVRDNRCSCQLFYNFRKKQTNVHEEERCGRPSLQTVEMVSVVDQKFRSDRRLTSEPENPHPQTERAKNGC